MLLALIFACAPKETPADEICDGVDNDGDGLVDEEVGEDWHRDADGDGHGDPTTLIPGCEAPTGYVADADDCDDDDAAVSPDAVEVCDGRDEDCDGVPDDGATVRAYTDADADGYGDPDVYEDLCEIPAGSVSEGTDCDDTLASVHPAADETCDTVDEDCNGAVDDDPAVGGSPWYPDADGDGWGDENLPLLACSQPDGYAAPGDCDDTDPTVCPDAIEACDGIDSDCDGLDDDTEVFPDVDGDGAGARDAGVLECEADPGVQVTNDWDCDDTDPDEPVFADAEDGGEWRGTLDSPYASLQTAIDEARTCVIAFGGTYEEVLTVTASLDIWGVEGAESTLIDPGLTTCDAWRPTDCSAAVTLDAVLSGSFHGFTVQNGTGNGTRTTTRTTCSDSATAGTCSVIDYSYCGGGLSVTESTLELYDLVVTDNTLPPFEQVPMGVWSQVWMRSFGGGVCLVDSTVDMHDVQLTGNFADQGGALYVEGTTLTLTHALVAENDAFDGAGLNADGGTVEATNSIFACNDADTDGGGLFLTGTTQATFTNTVLFGNRSATSGDERGSQAWTGDDTDFDLTNSIVEGDTTVALLYGTGIGDHTYDDVHNDDGDAYGGALSAGTGSISVGGNFVAADCDGDATNDDYTLVGTSAAIDAGDPSVADPDGTRGDMGAYGGPEGAW